MRVRQIRLRKVPAVLPDDKNDEQRNGILQQGQTTDALARVSKGFLLRWQGKNRNKEPGEDLQQDWRIAQHFNISSRQGPDQEIPAQQEDTDHDADHSGSDQAEQHNTQCIDEADLEGIYVTIARLIVAGIGNVEASAILQEFKIGGLVGCFQRGVDTRTQNRSIAVLR